MVKTIRACNFIDRKNNFRDMVDKFCSYGLFKERINLDLWLKNDEHKSNRLANDSKRWKNFQIRYKEEFENKIRLIDEIWEKKKKI